MLGEPVAGRDERRPRPRRRCPARAGIHDGAGLRRRPAGLAAGIDRQVLAAAGVLVPIAIVSVRRVRGRNHDVDRAATRGCCRASRAGPPPRITPRRDQPRAALGWEPCPTRSATWTPRSSCRPPRRWDSARPTSALVDHETGRLGRHQVITATQWRGPDGEQQAVTATGRRVALPAGVLAEGLRQVRSGQRLHAVIAADDQPASAGVRGSSAVGLVDLTSCMRRPASRGSGAVLRRRADPRFARSAVAFSARDPHGRAPSRAGLPLGRGLLAQWPSWPLRAFLVGGRLLGRSLGCAFLAAALVAVALALRRRGLGRGAALVAAAFFVVAFGTFLAPET